MEGVTRKAKAVRTKRKRGFEYDPKEVAEYSKPAPRQDPEGAAIAIALSRLNGRHATGYVIDWRPVWLAGLDAFRYFFHEDLLVVDTFSVPGGEMDVFDSTPAWMEEMIAKKAQLCAERGLIYVPVRPDEELDTVQLAAKIGKTRIKKHPEEAHTP